MCVLVFAMGARLLYLSMRSKATQRRLGEVDVAVRVFEEGRGHILSVDVAFEPERAIEVRDAYVILVGQEVFTFEYKGQPREKTERLHRTVAPLEVGPSLSARQPVRETAYVPWPSSPIPSFESPRTSVRWRAHVRINIVGGLDYVEEVPVVVRAVAPEQTTASATPVDRGEHSGDSPEQRTGTAW